MRKEFRAWDGKKMYYWDSIDHPEVDKIKGTPYPKLFFLPMSYLLGDCNDWDWQQFTGLLDKNGKKIFEGDIVKYTKHNGYLLDDFIAEVFWKDVQWSIGRADGKMYDVDLSEVDDLEDDLFNYLKIIGNIYENKKLLNEKL